MGRKFDKKGKQKKRAIRESDASWRMTYLWGAAQLLSHRAPSMSKFFVGCIKQIGRRVTLPLDALTVKRLCCARCNAMLIPGEGGTTVRLAKRRERHVVIRCGSCGYVKRYLCRKQECDRDAFEGDGDRCEDSVLEDRCKLEGEKDP